MLRWGLQQAGTRARYAEIALAFVLGLARPCIADNVGAGPVRYVPDNLYGIDFVDARHGVATGYYGTVLHTADAGHTWTVGSVSAPELLRRVRLLDADNGWAVGHLGGLFATTDGGASWTVRYRVPGVYLRDLSFADRAHGWVVGHDQTILGTSDGGASWTRQTIRHYERRDPARLHGVVAIDSNRALAVGEFGVIAETRDGGANWDLLGSPSEVTLSAVAAAGEQAIAVGLDGRAVLISLDIKAEPRVKVLDTGTRQHLLDVSFSDPATAYAVGRAVALRYHAGEFTPFAVADSAQLDYSWLAGVDALADGSVWSVGSFGTVLRAAAGGGLDVAFRLGDAKPEAAAAVEASHGAQ